MANMISDKDYWTLKAMSKFGGGFVKLLAELAHHADPENFQRIKTTWSEYWSQYEKMGQSLKDKE